jgi:hypothetical protein
VPASRQPSGVAASEAMGPRPPSKRSTTCGHRQGVRVGDEGGGQQQHEERFLPLLLRADAGLAARMAAKEAARVPGRTPPHSRPPPAASASSEARPSRWCRPPAAGGRRGWGTGRPAARACLQRVSGACGCGCGCGVGKGGGEGGGSAGGSGEEKVAGRPCRQPLCAGSCLQQARRQASRRRATAGRRCAARAGASLRCAPATKVAAPAEARRRPLMVYRCRARSVWEWATSAPAGGETQIGTERGRSRGSEFCAS